MKESIFDTCILQYLPEEDTVVIRTNEKEKFVFDINNKSEIDDKIAKLENLIFALKHAKQYSPQKQSLFDNSHVQNQEKLTKKVYEYYNNKKEDRNLAQATDGFVFHHFGFGPTLIDVKNASDDEITKEVQRQEHLVVNRLIEILGYGNEAYHTLDIGCGRGGNMFKVAHEISNTKIEGINIADYHIDFCKKAIKDKNLNDRVNVTLGDFMSMPYNNNQFTHAYCSEVTQYAYDLNKLFSEVNRTLKTDGKFAILTWCWNNLSNTSDVKKIAEPINEHYASTMHSENNYKTALQNNGFELIHDEDRTDDLIPYWELRTNWSMKSGVEEYFIEGHKKRHLLYKLFVGKKLS